MHGHAPDVAGDRVDFARVDARPDSDPEACGAGVHLTRGSCRTRGAIERCEHPVPGRGNLGSPVPVECPTRLLEMLPENLVPGVSSKALDRRGRIDDVGEKDRRDVGVPARRRSAEPEDARDLDGLERFVTDDPCIVARRDVEDVVGSDVDLLTIRHLHVELAAYRHTEVADGAGWRADEGLEVHGPSPPGLDHCPAERLFADLDASLLDQLGVEDVVWRVQALQEWPGHGASLGTIEPVRNGRAPLTRYHRST